MSDVAEVRVGELSLRYLSSGDPADPAVVLLHGRGAPAETWTEVAEALSDRYYVLALQQRGSGGSSWSPTGAYHLADFVADLEAFVDDVVPGPFVLVGHSMGACTALVYAARHPGRLRALVLEDGGPLGPAVVDSLGGAHGRIPSSFPSWTEAGAHLRAQGPALPHDRLDGLVAATFRERPDGTVGWRADVDGLFSAESIGSDELFLTGQWDALQGLTTPTLLLWASAQPSLMEPETADRIERANPCIRRVTIDSGHRIHEQRFPEFMAAIEPFLAAATASAGALHEKVE
jgi:pimeloyl-ACP methyl ester carboxylesterase